MAELNPDDFRRTPCSAPDPFTHGWYPCDLDRGHDGPHGATTTIERMVPVASVETYRLQWELVDYRIPEEDRGGR